jgi:anti-sigma B factor antagonist
MGLADPLRIDVLRVGDRLVISLHGELDLANAPLLQSALDDLELVDAATVVLDLHELAFIDSTGLRTIFSARDRFVEQGRQFAVTPGSQQVQRLLTVTRAGEHLNTIASVCAPADVGPPA